MRNSILSIALFLLLHKLTRGKYDNSSRTVFSGHVILCYFSFVISRLRFYIRRNWHGSTALSPLFQKATLYDTLYTGVFIVHKNIYRNIRPQWTLTRNKYNPIFRTLLSKSETYTFLIFSIILRLKVTKAIDFN